MSLTQETIPLDDGELILITELLPNPEAILQTLLGEVPWQQDTLRFGGREVPIPRLQSWHGEPHCTYTYSRLKMAPKPMTPTLESLRQRMQLHAATPFNCVLCNYYRSGNDSVSWHADNEPELGPNPVIASISLGYPREFQLRPNRPPRSVLKLLLPHNSLLIMRGRLQHFWQHQLPKTSQADLRLNLTYRYIPAL
ncbi:MAG: alpha-ketoglutarate-dependent dioxygenase AlkB [Hahellaceae bacterium]|nr:alpha-ketoglutarate-dependent dioxygenase AlkB [Hahellaceae bacterium]